MHHMWYMCTYAYKYTHIHHVYMHIHRGTICMYMFTPLALPRRTDGIIALSRAQQPTTVAEMLSTKRETSWVTMGNQHVCTKIPFGRRSHSPSFVEPLAFLPLRVPLSSINIWQTLLNKIFKAIIDDCKDRQRQCDTMDITKQSIPRRCTQK